MIILVCIIIYLLGVATSLVAIAWCDANFNEFGISLDKESALFSWILIIFILIIFFLCRFNHYLIVPFEWIYDKSYEIFTQKSLKK